jgi:hypothetical protein
MAFARQYPRRLQNRTSPKFSPLSVLHRYIILATRLRYVVHPIRPVSSWNLLLPPYQGCLALMARILSPSQKASWRRTHLLLRYAREASAYCAYVDTTRRRLLPGRGPGLRRQHRQRWQGLYWCSLLPLKESVERGRETRHLLIALVSRLGHLDSSWTYSRCSGRPA